MMPLITRGLMFGNLVALDSPALVARCNRALKHLTGRTTALPDFHLDISGYSPEIGDEFGDTRDLNPDGANRKFILLTTEQKRAPRLEAGSLPIAPAMDLGDRNDIADWLDRNGLAESIATARGVDTAALLRQKMDFVLVAAAEALGVMRADVTRADLRGIARQLGPALPDEFKGLADLLRWAEAGGSWPRITSEHPACFPTLRAAAGPDRDLVNQLLSELSPLDVRQLDICHKARFYRDYRGWFPAKQEWGAASVAREYALDNAGARATLVVAGPGMNEAPRPAAPCPAPRAVVGPRGAAARATATGRRSGHDDDGGDNDDSDNDGCDNGARSRKRRRGR